MYRDMRSQEKKLNKIKLVLDVLGQGTVNVISSKLPFLKWNIRSFKALSDLCALDTKELYTGTPNSDIRILCTVHYGRNANNPSAPPEVEGKGLKL